MSTVEDRVRKIVVEQLGVKEEELKNDAIVGNYYLLEKSNLFN